MGRRYPTVVLEAAGVLEGQPESERPSEIIHRPRRGIPRPRGLVVLRRPQVEAKTGLGRSAIYELMRRGLFPRPIRISGASVGWVEDEIDEWVEQQISERDARLASKDAAG